MSRRPRESESESEAEAEAPLRLDEPLAEEGLQDIDFDFDDPQERHAPVSYTHLTLPTIYSV